MNTASARTSRWVMVPKPNPAARWRLVCLAHAGGGASLYHRWGAALAEAGIEVRAVQYPGRENRFGEPAIADARALVRALADHWPEIAGEGPCALYGHSMGALLGFELTAELERAAPARAPRRLFLSSHHAPHLPYRAPRVHALPASEVPWAVQRNFGGIPSELLENPEIRDMMSATLKADFTLVENYTWGNTGPVAAPLLVLGGVDDPWATREELEGWARHARGPVEVRLMPGDHFFNVSGRAAVLALLAERLADAR